MSYDVLVLPVSQVPPFPADQEYPTEINGRPMSSYLDWMRSAYFISATGCPAISVPCGSHEGRAPGRRPDRRPARLGPAAAGDRCRVRGGGERMTQETDSQHPDRHRHRRHVHRRGRLRRGLRRAGHHEDPVDARQPGRRVHGRHRQGARPARPSGGARRRDRRGQPRHHGRDQPAARGEGGAARVHHHRGLRGDARDRPAVRAGRLRQLLLLGQAEPASSRATWSRESAAGWTSPGPRCGPSTRTSARTAARWFRDQGINTLGVCFLHSYADPGHEEQMRAVLAEEHPDAVVSLSSEVLREYREYERAMTTLIDAAVKPRLSAYVTNIKQRLAEYTSSDGQRPVPVLRDEVQRRRAQRRGGRAPADHDGALRAGGRRSRRCADRQGRRLRQGADQ